MSEELKPCPFCGYEFAEDDTNAVYPITKTKDLWACGCEQCSAQVVGESETESIQAWNTRKGQEDDTN